MPRGAGCGRWGRWAAGRSCGRFSRRRRAGGTGRAGRLPPVRSRCRGGWRPSQMGLDSRTGSIRKYGRCGLSWLSFPRSATASLGGAGDVKMVAVADHGPPWSLPMQVPGWQWSAHRAIGGGGRGFRGGAAAPVGGVAAAQARLGRVGALSPGAMARSMRDRPPECGGGGSGGAGESARRKREAQGEDEGGEFRRAEGGSQTGRATGAGTSAGRPKREKKVGAGAKKRAEALGLRPGQTFCFWKQLRTSDRWSASKSGERTN